MYRYEIQFCMFLGRTNTWSGNVNGNQGEHLPHLHIYRGVVFGKETATP